MVAISLFFVFSLVISAKGTVDLNIHQLQMVADHLKIKECKKLVNALHQNTFELKQDIEQSDELNKPCIALLLQWDRTDGDSKSFDDLAFRLGQIGRTDLSEKLSKSVYGEKADALDKLFLNDPFKKSVPKKSLLLDEKKKLKKKNKILGEETSNFSGWEIASIVCGGFVAFCILVYLIYYLFGDAISKLFRTYAPDFVVTWFDLVSNECAWFCKKTKRKYYEEVIGSHRVSGNQARSLTQLNRNLNCFLNEDSLEAVYYFDELMSNYKRVK